MIGKPNPRGKKIDKQSGTGPRFGSPLAYVLLVLVAFLLLRTLFQDAGFQRVPYSRLVDRIQSDGCQKERCQWPNKGFELHILLRLLPDVSWLLPGFT